MKYTSVENLSENLPYYTLRLGISCNAGCLFCNVLSDTEPQPEMTTARAFREIDWLCSSKRRVRLDITGGEPTIRSDLPRIVRYASEKGISVIQVQTNGIRLSEARYVRRLKNAGLHKLFVGLHASCPAIHDFLSGRQGAFSRCVAGIRNALKSGIEVVLNPVITTANYKNLPEFIHFVHETFPEIRTVSLSVAQPRGRAWRNRRLIPRYAFLNAPVRKALQKTAKWGIVLNNPVCGLPFCIGSWYKYPYQCVEYCENMLHPLDEESSAEKYGKIKPAQCIRCAGNPYCNGVWKEYAVLYPLDDLKPLRAKQWQI